MSDFSFFSLFTAGLALFGPLADAYTQPKGASPKGNPISAPGLATVVPAGKPYTVVWEPTTKGTITLVLLKGPSTNAEPQYAIAENIPNDGTYVWTPSKDLEPTDGDEGYGIQLIVDSNGQYQYTTQFGVSNPNYKASDASSTTSSAATTSSTDSSSSDSHHGNGWGKGKHGEHHGGPKGGYGHGPHNVHSGYTHPAAPSGTSISASSMMTSSYAKGNGTTSAGHAQSTGWMTKNVTMVLPTGGLSTSKPGVSGSATTGGYGGASASASGSGAPQATDNGAAAMVGSLGGLVLAAGAAVFAL